MIREDKNTQSKNFLPVIGMVLSIIFFFSAPSNAQFPFYYSFYNPGSYLVPYFPSYFPLAGVPVYNPPYYNPSYIPTPVPAVGLTTPSVLPNPTASVSGLLTDLLLLGSTNIDITPTIADFLINTGNPQVDAVLALVAANPSLADYPLLLNSLINTGNPQVALYLSLLSF